MKRRIDFMDLGPLKPYKVTLRIDLLRDMPAESLALYLAAELDDGVPTDWLAWLLEEL